MLFHDDAALFVITSNMKATGNIHRKLYHYTGKFRRAAHNIVI